MSVMTVRILDDEIHELQNVCERPAFGRQGGDVDRADTQTHLSVSRHAVRTRHFGRQFEAEGISQPVKWGA